MPPHEHEEEKNVKGLTCNMIQDILDLNVINTRFNNIDDKPVELGWSLLTVGRWVRYSNCRYVTSKTIDCLEFSTNF